MADQRGQPVYGLVGQQPQQQQPAAGQQQPPAAQVGPYQIADGDITNPYAMTWNAYSTKLKPYLDATYPAVRPPAVRQAAAQPAAAAAAPAGLRQQARAAADMAAGLLTGPGPRLFINGRGGIPDANGRAILDAIKAVLPAGNQYNTQRAATNDAARTYWNTHLDAGAVAPGGVAAPFVVADYKTAIVNAIN